MAGYLRTVNIRGLAEFGPEADETVIDLDRKHVLGNQNRLADRNNMVERLKVIQEHRNDLDKDFAFRGPLFEAILALAVRVAGGEKICGRCWCAPLPCHVDEIALRVNVMAGAILEDRDPASAWSQYQSTHGSASTPAASAAPAAPRRGFSNLRRPS